MVVRLRRLLELNSKPRRIELRYFAGCPRAETARQLLQACLKKLAIDVPIEEKEGDYPSPTVLIDVSTLLALGSPGGAAAPVNPEGLP